MTAKVGDITEWVYGEKPPGGVPNLLTKVGHIIGSTQRYIAGHLLNDNMGGLGTNDNLTVLSSNANKAHRGIEGKVKALAIKANQINQSGKSKFDHGVRYSVLVGPTSPGAPKYRAERYVSSGITVSIDPIRIHKASKVESPWTEMSAEKVTKRLLPNVPPYPAIPALPKIVGRVKDVIDAIKALKVCTLPDLVKYLVARGVPRKSIGIALAKAKKAKYVTARAGTLKVSSKYA